MEQSAQLFAGVQIGNLLYSLRALQDSAEARSLAKALTPKVRPGSLVLQYAVLLGAW